MRDKLMRMWLMAVAAAALASCSQDGGGWEPVPDGDAVVLTATGITPATATRATADGTWTGTEHVWVKVGDDIREYAVKASADDGKTATLEAAEGEEPFRWSQVEGKKLEAYTPAATPDIKDDQSTPENYQASDCIHASNESMTKETVLGFSHEVARVVVKVNGGDIDNDEVKLVVGNRTITPLRDTENNRYLALVSPGDYSVISFRIKHGGKNYIHNVSDKELKANDSYVVNLTVDDRFHIYSYDDLKEWAAAVAASKNKDVSCELEADITMPAVLDGESNWEPINLFYGTFDGNGHTIKGLRIKQNKSDNGFFRNIASSAEVKNLTLDDAEVTGSKVAGAVALSNFGEIFHCYVTDSKVESYSYVGGIAAYNANSGKITFCGVSGCTVSGSDGSAGGIVGNNAGDDITGCYAVCKLEVNSSGLAGGIAGKSYGNITACYSDCEFTDSGIKGGIIGHTDMNWPKNCYWHSNTASNIVGDGMTEKNEKTESWTTEIMENMNGALPTDAEYIFKANDGSNIPYIHVKKNNK